MVSDSDVDDTIRATILAKMHREGFYDPRAVAIDRAAAFGIASHNRGRAKALVDEMARSDQYPIKFHRVGSSVMLQKDSHSWVAAAIKRHGGVDAVPWDLESYL